MFCLPVEFHSGFRQQGFTSFCHIVDLPATKLGSVYALPSLHILVDDMGFEHHTLIAEFTPAVVKGGLWWSVGIHYLCCSTKCHKLV